MSKTRPSQPRRKLRVSCTISTTSRTGPPPRHPRRAITPNLPLLASLDKLPLHLSRFRLRRHHRLRLLFLSNLHLKLPIHHLQLRRALFFRLSERHDGEVLRRWRDDRGYEADVSGDWCALDVEFAGVSGGVACAGAVGVDEAWACCAEVEQIRLFRREYCHELEV